MTYLEYPEDCQRLQRILLANHYTASLEECQQLWTEVSEAAGDMIWWILPETDQEVIERINQFSKRLYII